MNGVRLAMPTMAMTMSMMKVTQRIHVVNSCSSLVFCTSKKQKGPRAKAKMPCGHVRDKDRQRRKNDVGQCKTDAATALPYHIHAVRVVIVQGAETVQGVVCGITGIEIWAARWGTERNGLHISDEAGPRSE